MGWGQREESQKGQSLASSSSSDKPNQTNHNPKTLAFHTSPLTLSLCLCFQLHHHQIQFNLTLTKWALPFNPYIYSTINININTYYYNYYYYYYYYFHSCKHHQLLRDYATQQINVFLCIYLILITFLLLTKLAKLFRLWSKGGLFLRLRWFHFHVQSRWWVWIFVSNQFLLRILLICYVAENFC